MRLSSDRFACVGAVYGVKTPVFAEKCAIDRWAQRWAMDALSLE
jgi:hypothetical protein